MRIKALLLVVLVLAASTGSAKAGPFGDFFLGAANNSSSCSYPLPLNSDIVAAAYSFRKLYSSYAGYAVQLTRASDSTTMNIGFASNGCDFNNATASTFCASTTCTVTEWYDQSGNSANITPGTAPAYTASCLNGQPCATFTQASSQYLHGTLASSVTANTIALVGHQSTTSISDALVALGYNGGGAGDNGSYVGYSTSSTACDDIRIVSGTAYKATGSCTIGSNYRIGGTSNATLGRTFVSGVAGTDSTTSLSLTGSTQIHIGAGQVNGGSVGTFLNGALSEVIVFAPDISSTDYGTVSSNQASYWNVP